MFAFFKVLSFYLEFVICTNAKNLCSQVNTERAIRHAIQDHLPIVVVINKVHFLLQYVN